MELTVGEARMLFSLLDSNNSNTIEIEDFVLGCMQLRGGARNFDVALLRLECQYICDYLHSTEEERISMGPPPNAAPPAHNSEHLSRRSGKSTATLSSWILGRNRNNS